MEVRWPADPGIWCKRVAVHMSLNLDHWIGDGYQKSALVPAHWTLRWTDARFPISVFLVCMVRSYWGSQCAETSLKHTYVVTCISLS